MVETRPELSAAARTRRAALGVAMVVAGFATLAWLVYIANSTSPGAERTLMVVGLAGGSLISATAQAALLIGAWLIWTTRRRPPRVR